MKHKTVKYLQGVFGVGIIDEIAADSADEGILLLNLKRNDEDGWRGIQSAFNDLHPRGHIMQEFIERGKNTLSGPLKEVKKNDLPDEVKKV
mgnify:CR=1 FL=1